MLYVIIDFLPANYSEAVMHKLFATGYKPVIEMNYHSQLVKNIKIILL